jgi:hypothetical protein
MPLKETTYTHEFTVTGGGPFPFDMLRYDCAYPAHSWDASALLDHGSDDGGLRTVTLHAQRPKGWTPTWGRWSSFGWPVAYQSYRLV